MVEIKNRFLSLDVFRGLIIGFMIIVNMPGNPETTVPALIPARWNGFTPADLIYPSFLFCLGIGLCFSIVHWRQEHSVGKVFLRISRRCLLLFIIGILVNWFPFFQIDMFSNKIIPFPFGQVRFWGILQRIALIYFLVSLMLLFFKLRATLAIAVILLVLYWPVLYYGGTLPSPYSIRDNLVLKIDTWMVGVNHLDQDTNIIPFDDCGFLSTFPAISNMVAGYLAGRFIMRMRLKYETLTLLLLTGFLMLSLSYIWNYVFPVNRKLWTSSFAVQMIGLDLCIIALIIYVVDKIRYVKEANFLRVLGRNPLVAYILSVTLIIPLQLVEVEPGVSIMSWLYMNIFSYATAYIGSFLQAVFFMVLIWGLCWLLDKRQDYITV